MKERKLTALEKRQKKFYDENKGKKKEIPFFKYYMEASPGGRKDMKTRTPKIPGLPRKSRRAMLKNKRTAGLTPEQKKNMVKVERNVNRLRNEFRTRFDRVTADRKVLDILMKSLKK